MKRSVSLFLCAVLLTALCLTNNVLPVTAEGESVIVGGDFEATAGDTIYAKNWAAGVFSDSATSPACTIVEDTSGESEGNHCLEVPLYTDGKYNKYLKGLSLQPNTSYTLSFDARGGGVWVFVGSYGVTDAPGVVWVSSSEEWKRYNVTFHTGDNTDNALSSFVDWGISITRDPSYATTVEAVSYLDNFKLEVTPDTEEKPEEPEEPNTAVENKDNYVQGGSFEFPADDTIYKTNFAMLSSLSIVQDPKNTNNHCLYIPQSPAKDYYFTNLKLEPLTTYVFEFDILSEGTAGVYFWGSSVFQNNTGIHAIVGSPNWQHIKYEVKTTAAIRDNTAYPNYLFAFMKSYEPYNQSDMYIDNVSITAKQKEAPSVNPVVVGGDFEDSGALNENWATALNKATVVEDTLRDSNHCLKIPKADSPIGDVYLKNTWLEPNTTYYVTFEARGGTSRIFFYSNALLENGAKTIAASDEWRSYAFRITTRDDDTYLKGGYQNYIIGFIKNDNATNTADTFIDNFRVVKAGAYVDPELEYGRMTLSSWKEPDTVGTQAAPAAGGTVVVTVTPDDGYMLKPGSLYYVTEDGTKQQILNKESGDFGEGSGDTFRFVLPEGSVIVTAEFVPTAAQNFRFEMLGTSVYYETGAAEPNGLRFLNRLYIDGLNVEDDTLTVMYNGKTYTVTEFGSLLKRTNNEAELTLENVSDTASSATRVWKAAAYTNGVMKLVDHTESYVDFTVIMKTSAANKVFSEREYTACGYMILSDGANTVTLYSKALTDSVQKTAVRTTYLPNKDDDWRLHPQDFKLIASTFDRPDFTDGTGKMELIIEALHAQGGSATLNVAGESLAEGSAKRDSQIALLSDALSKGFEIGSYTWGNNTWGYSKDELNARTEEELMKYIADTQAVVQETLGVTPEYLRPPLLLSNDTVVSICKTLGISIVTGNTSWRDFSSGYTLEVNGGATYDSLIKHARDGAIWILHAHNGDTPTEYARAIADLYEQGYRFCTVAELVEYNGQTRQPGVGYNEVVAVY